MTDVVVKASDVPITFVEIRKHGLAFGFDKDGEITVKLKDERPRVK